MSTGDENEGGREKMDAGYAGAVHKEWPGDSKPLTMVAC